MTETKNYEGSVADRLERLPSSKFQRNFLLMLTSGEWAESLMLLGNGAVLFLVISYYSLTGAYSAYAIPVPFFVGEFFGSIFFGRLADRKGRRTVFLYNQLLFGAGMLIAGFMQQWQLIALFVFVGGIGVGGEFPLVDSYGTEVFKGHHRGSRLAMIYTLAVTAAPIIIYITSVTHSLGPLAGTLKSGPVGYYSFRIPLWIMGISGFIVWALRLRLTESPRWLEIHGRYKEADQVMTHIEETVKKDLNLKELPPVENKTSLAEKPSNFKDIFAPDVRKTTFMMMIFQFFQSGIFYGFVTFAPGIVISKYPLNNPLGFAAVIFSGFVFGSIFNIFIIDKVERKLGIIAFAILGGIFGTLFVAVGNITEFVAFGFLTSFALWNFSNFLHQYNAEVFPTRVRTTAAGFVYSLSRISTAILIIIIAVVFQPHGSLAIFAFIWVLVAICVIDLMVLGPKTSGRKIEEIAQ